MKLAKCFISFALVLAMLAGLSVSVLAESETAQVEFYVVSSETLSNETDFTTYDISGSVSGNTAKSYVFEFNPADGNIPLAYTGVAGSVTTMEKHMENAANEGYEVVGAINGSFFQGATSTMTGMLISDGRIICADSGDLEPLACFDANGNMTHASGPSLKFSVTLNGTENADALVAVNKRYSYIEGKSSTSAELGNFFYYDRHAAATVANGEISGYEILCNKLDLSEIAVGETLKGEVVSVAASTFGASIPENDDQFVLFIKSDSDFAEQVSALESGDRIEIFTEATTDAAVLKNAYSAISSSYWLVYDGVDQTNKYSTIIHSVTLARAWTAFGVKEDGTFVYFVNEEYGLTLKDVAAAMMELGCVYVIRVDGGGSSAVYTESGGIVYLAERPEQNGRMVCDTLLIVKKSSLADDELTQKLEDAVATAKDIDSPNATLSANIANAEAVLNLEYPVKGMVKRAFSNLDISAVLSDTIKQAEAADPAHYDSDDYSAIQTAISDAKKLIDSGEATDEELKKAIEVISSYLALSKYEVISIGASYEVTQGLNYDYWSEKTLFHDDGSRLVDGAKSTSGVLSATYSAWKKDADPAVEVVVDLGEEVSSNTYKIYTCGGFWGIAQCSGITVEGSNDNESFEAIGTTDVITDVGNGDLVDGSAQSTLHSLSIATDTLQNYRYIKFTMTINGNFLWVDEVEVAYDGTIAPEDIPSSNVPSDESVPGSESDSADSSADTSKTADDDDNMTMIIIITVAAIIVAVVIVLVLKSRKKK